MPKIEVNKDLLFSLWGRVCTPGELERLLPTAKAELDGVDDEAGVLKIELNDTNRPDLWSAAGLARQLKVFDNAKAPEYPFFSNSRDKKDAGKYCVEVDKSLKAIRPFLSGFVISGITIDDPTLIEMIQIQEKLSWNFGRKRKTISMGIYRSDLINFPVRYIAVDPEKTRFIPLQSDEEMNLNEILEKHPKGVEFANTLAGFDKYPYLVDNNDNVLSFPPIINSNLLGAVQVGDKELFIELTGDDLPVLTLATSIVACAFADMGFSIQPAKVIYPFDTPFGREVVFPYYFQEPTKATVEYINKMIGSAFSAKEIQQSLEKMGNKVEVSGDSITLYPPTYRNDFLHPVDVVEDVVIGRGMESFEPEMPSDFTVGRLSPEEHYAREVRRIMVGLGFQEMIYNYLGSGKDYIEKMGISGKNMVQIANPMTENYEFVRNSILPELLRSESVSGHAVYPHRIFEVGKVAYLDESDVTGTVTQNFLGFLNAESEAGFTMINNQLSALMFYLGIEYNVSEFEDPRFIPGRCALIEVKGGVVGILGEIHPKVLTEWGIEMPCNACEVDLDLLLASRSINS